MKEDYRKVVRKYYNFLFYGVFTMLTSLTLFRKANFVNYTHYSLFTCIYFVFDITEKKNSRHLLRLKGKYWRLFSAIDLRIDFLLAFKFPNCTLIKLLDRERSTKLLCCSWLSLIIRYSMDNILVAGDRSYHNSDKILLCF
jgi:hypothetical protein